MSKKIIWTLIILIMLFSAFPFGKLEARDIEKQFNSLYGDGEATLNSDAETGKKSQVIGIGTTQSQNITLSNVLANVISIIPLAINKMLAIVALNNEKIIEYNGQDLSLFTIEGLLTNKYPLFNIDLFENVESGPNSDLSNNIKKNAAIWYVSIRNLAVACATIILIYVGIRMAIATTAQDEAKYKQMLTSWFIGVVLLFVIHYLVILMIKTSNIFIDFIKNAIEKDTDTTSMELIILTDVFSNISKAEGWNKLYYTILYCVLTYYELKFFVMYLFRVFKIFIMMVVAPLICITYPIDAVGDGKAQGFNNWFRKIMMEIFIQPIHLVIYIVFIYSAGEIAKAVPLIAVVFVIALDNGEKIIRSALKIQGKGLKDIKILGKG